MDLDRLGERLKKSTQRIKSGAEQVRQMAVEAQARADEANVDRQVAREEARKRQVARTKRGLLILAPVLVVCIAVLAIMGAVEGRQKPAEAVTESTTSAPVPAQSDSPTPVVTETAVAAPSPVAALGATTTGLTGTFAQSACDQYGAQQFPYGWKPHWITGRLADEAQGDTYYLKYTATVTNAYNAQQDINFECYVTGTNDNPTVANFLAY